MVFQRKQGFRLLYAAVVTAWLLVVVTDIKADWEDWEQSFLWKEHSKFTSLDNVSGDYFGHSISTSGDYCIIGAPGDDDSGSSSGSAYIFAYDGNNWIQQAKLTASDAASNDIFGHSVSISDNVCAIGAPYDDDNGSNSGSAYIFAFDGNDWTQQAKLTASDGASGDFFGCSISISDNHCVIGAYEYGLHHGCAYIFVRDGNDWTQQAKLTASDGASEDYFGYSVSISGDCCIIGAYRSRIGSIRYGAAYIFAYDGNDWTQQAKLTASDKAEHDSFGRSVSICDHLCVIGSPGDDGIGSAYIFAYDGNQWNQQTKLIALDGFLDDAFGSSVSICGGYCAIGAGFSDEVHLWGRESVYIFAQDGNDWNQQVKISASDKKAGNKFGFSVSIYNNYCMVGSPRNDENGNNSGAAYVIQSACPDVDFNSDCCVDFTDYAFLANEWMTPKEDANEQTKILADDPTAETCFGNSVSISGGFCVIGAPGYKPTYYPDTPKVYGSAYVFIYEPRSWGRHWFQQAKLIPPQRFSWDLFGCSVSISGNYCVVGASNYYSAGSAYIFSYDGNEWTQQVKLNAFGGAAGDCFGDSVSICGNYCAIGDSGDDDHGEDSGSVFIFIRDGNNWIPQTKLTASDANEHDYFCSVSLSDKYCVVGAWGDDDKGENSGSAYIFTYDGNDWFEQAKLIASDGAAHDRFGCSVSISNDYCVIGAWGDNDKGENSGSAYIFAYDGNDWVQQIKLLASDGNEDERFGSSVSIYGNRCVVGAPGFYPAWWEDPPRATCGSAYVFVNDGVNWSQQIKLTASDGTLWDGFGDSVSTNGNFSAIGAPYNDDFENFTGSIYIFPGDFQVNWYDLHLFTSQWLQCGNLFEDDESCW